MRTATFGYWSGPRSPLPPVFDASNAARFSQVKAQFDTEGVFLSVVDANICS